MRLQKKIHEDTLKITIVSVLDKPKQNQQEWVQSSPWENHSQYGRQMTFITNGSN